MGIALTFPTRGLLTENGLELPTDLTYEEWLGVMGKLFTLEKVTWWAIGDALAFGETAYGEKYAQAMALSQASGINVDTLRKAQWVAERVPVVLRRTSLSWSHHQTVAALDPAAQEALLAKAEEHEMSVSALTDSVRTYKRALTNGGEPLAGKREGQEADLLGSGPKPKPVGEEPPHEHGSEDEAYEVDFYAEWQRAEKENEALRAELESLTATDKDRELRALHARVAGVEGRLTQETQRANEAVRQAKYQGNVLRKVRDLLKVEKNSEIGSNIVELLQR